MHALKPYVEQYDPVRKRWIRHSDPGAYLKEHVIRGDRGDGVPNIRTQDSAIALGDRQKTVSSKMLNGWLESGIPRELDRNYQRNKTLIDLTQIPEKVKLGVIEEFNKPVQGDRKQLFNYFVKHGLKNLMENINEF